MKFKTMKSTFFLFSIFACSLLSAQQISDYVYVVVPEKFSPKNFNQYNLRENLISQISKKNYKVLPENAESWPAEAQQNPCSVLNADLQDISTMLRNKVRVVFKDCSQKTFSFDGASYEKSYEDGYPDALNIAARNIPASKGTLPTLSTQNPVKTVETIPAAGPKIVTASATKFVSGELKVQKINISENQFIFTRQNSSVPYATFKKSLKNGVYYVQLENKVQTLGYSENGNFVIEIPQQGGETVQQIFIPKD